MAPRVKRIQSFATTYEYTGTCLRQKPHQKDSRLDASQSPYNVSVIVGTDVTVIFATC